MENGQTKRIKDGWLIMQICGHCRSTTIKQKVNIGTNEGSFLGLMYDRYQLEPMYADVCLQCGTMVRQYVDQPNRNWQSETIQLEKRMRQALMMLAVMFGMIGVFIVLALILLR